MKSNPNLSENASLLAHEVGRHASDVDELGRTIDGELLRALLRHLMSNVSHPIILRSATKYQSTSTA